MTTKIPMGIVRAAAGGQIIGDLSEEPIGRSSGAATGNVVRIAGNVLINGQARSFSLIRKTVRPLTSGRHAEASVSPTHWAYWLREPFAYEAGLPPTGPGLRAPRCYGVIGDTIYLEEVIGCEQSPDIAAHHLGLWQRAATVPDVPWLAGHQLEQRIAVSHLDWSSVDADPRAIEIWTARHTLLNELVPLPRVLTHGDFSLGNLLGNGQDTVALDWATVGVAPAGADLAHLALSSLVDPSPATWPPPAVCSPNKMCSSATRQRRHLRGPVACTGCSPLRPKSPTGTSTSSGSTVHPCYAPV